MKYLLPALAAFLLYASMVFGVDTAAIDSVRSKAALTEADGAIIDQFVDSIVRDILVRTDFTSVSQTREALTSRLEATTPNPRYAELMAASIEKQIGEGLAEAEKLSDAGRKASVKMNLLLMLEKAGQVATAKMAAAYLGDADAGVRYYAAKCAANPAVLSRLNSGGQENTAAARDLAARLKGIVATESNPKVLEPAVEFGAGLNMPEGVELLVSIANRRISDYEKWTVKNELLDGKLLNALCSKAKANKSAATAFGQLLSHCIQKYMKQMAAPSYMPVMGEQQAVYLATALAAVEKGCLGELRGGSTAIQAAISKGAGGASALSGEYTLLFGGEGTQGELTKVFGAKYPDAAGREQDLPRPLPDKPAVNQ